MKNLDFKDCQFLFFGVPLFEIVHYRLNRSFWLGLEFWC